jgi:hypothetical protein
LVAWAYRRERRRKAETPFGIKRDNHDGMIPHPAAKVNSSLRSALFGGAF